MGAEYQIALRSRLSRQDRQAEHLNRRQALLQLVQKIDVWLDGASPRSRSGGTHARSGRARLVNSPFPAPASMKTVRAGNLSTISRSHRLAFRFWSV